MKHTKEVQVLLDNGAEFATKEEVERITSTIRKIQI